MRCGGWGGSNVNSLDSTPLLPGSGRGGFTQRRQERDEGGEGRV